jgi:DUF4097 and DUF4098 domain-containing protein YvlB
MPPSHPTKRHFRTPRPVRLEIKIPLGTIDVTTIDGDESSVTVEGSSKLVDATSIELEGDRLLVRSRKQSFAGLFGSLDGSVRVHVRVPHGSSVELATSSVDATLDGTFADLDVRSASGNVRLTGDLAGDANVRTVSGGVRLAHVAGDVSMSTVSGSVSADSVDGSVTMRSVSGAMRVGSLREGTVKVQSVSGDIELGIAAGTSIDVDASTASGNLVTEVPLSDTPAADAGRTVVVRSSTVSGDLRVFRAEAGRQAAGVS